MPDKKYLIEIPDMPDSSGVWDADKWERNKDKFMQKYPTANVFELGAYDPNDMDENDQFMLTFDNDEESSGVWDAAKWERNKDKFLSKYPDAHVNRVRYMDYWGDKAKSDQARIAELQQPDEERNARLAEIGYYDDSTGTQVDYANSVGLSPLSSAIEQNSVSGEVTYLDPRVEEFFANDTEYTDRQMELNRLRDEYEANPRVIEQREYEAQMARYAEELEKQIKADMEADVDAYHAGQGAAAKHMQDASGANQTIQAIRMLKGEDVGKDVIENEKQERYASALKLLQQAKDARNVAGKGMAGGVVDTAKDWARNLGTQSDIEMYNEVGNILTALEQKVGNLNEVSDEVIEENLTNDEKALIRAFFEYNAAMADAGEDMSIWYKGGKIFAESIPFMMEFLVTGGLANTAGRAATSWMGKGFGKWIAKSAKGTAARAAKKVAAKTVSGVAKTVVAAGARTLAAPTTYKNIAEQSVQYGADGHLDREGNMVKAAVDSYIEQLSEMSGAAFGKVLGGVGRLALGKTAFEKVGAWFGNNAVMQNLSKLGFHGLPEEVGEEIFGNALRTITGVDEEALSRMFEKDEFASMIIGFAPMTLFGAGMSMAKMGAVSIGAANAGRRMRQDLSRSYTEEQIDQVEMALDEAKDANEIANAIRPIIMGMQAAGAPLYEVQSVWDYAIAVAKKKAMVSAQSAQELQLAQAKIGEAQERMGGRFWIEDKDGVKSVKQVVLNNGNTAYVVSEPDQDGRVAIINATTGQKGTALPEDIKEESWNGTLNAFGTGLVMADRTQREQQRMQEDRAAQINEVRNRLSADPRINVGTEGSPIYLVAQSFNDAGVRYVAQDGSAGNISWEQAADSIGMPIIVKTDAQIAQEEAETLVAAAAERRAKRAKKDAVGTTERDNAVVDAENAVAGANEAARHIPMNEDGTVNEAAFWEQSPEEYVKWNDEQNQDGGQDSLQQVAIAKQELMGLLQEANAAQNTSNPTTRKAAKKEVERLADRIARLDAIEQSYMQSLEEEKAAVQQTAATPTSSMSEEDLESMDAQYQGILGKTRVQGERVRVMQEYLDKLAEGSVPVVLLTRQNYEEKMKADGLHNAIIRRVKAQVDAGRSVAGFMANGKVYLMDEGLNSIDAARITYIHERQHTFNRTNNDMLAEVANLLESKEKAIEILKTFVGEKGIGVYESLSIEGLADEIVAYSMEKAYTTEDFSVDLQSRGIPSEVISIITEIDNEQRKDQSLSQARRRRGVHSHAAVSGAGSVREDGRNLEQISGGVLEQQAARPSGSSGRGAQIGEGAEVEEESEVEPKGPDFRVTKPENIEDVTELDGTVRFSVRTYHDWTDNLGHQHKGTRAMVIEKMEEMKFSKRDIKKMVAKMDAAYDYMEKLRTLTDDQGRVRFEEFNEWAKATPLYKQVGRDYVKAITSLVSNGDYPINLELTTDCIKREAFTHLLNALVKRGAQLSGMGPAQIITMQKVMKQYGIEVACQLCFVEGKRLQIVNWASQIVEDWNDALEQAGVETDEYFEFGKDGDAFIPSEEWRTYEDKPKLLRALKAIDDAALLFQGIDPETFNAQRKANQEAVAQYIKEKSEAWAKKNNKPASEWKPNDVQKAEIKKLTHQGLAPSYVNENLLEYRDAFNRMRNEWLEKHPNADPLSFSPTKKQWEALDKIRNRQIDNVKAKMVRLIMEHPEMRKKMTINDLLGSKGLMEIRQQHGQPYADLYSIILQRFGTGTPKPVQDAVPYDGEVLTLTESAFKKANEIGGARLFSFSDFDITKVFDYMQMFFDLEAKRQKLQSYTKEVAAVLIFGRSNAKFNISTLANAFVPAEVQEEYKKASEKKQKELRHKWAENAGLIVDENGTITGINFSEEHSVSPEFAQSIFRDDTRNKDCGAIMVGASVNHAIYSAAVNWIRMVIPFHLSGMPLAAREKTDVLWYTDNTEYQSTRKKTKDGWSKIEASKDTFNLYEGMDQPGWDMRQRAKDYLTWCAENGYRPKFDWGINSDYYRAYCEEAGYTPNQQIIDIMDADTADGVWNQYYKFLTDFTAYKPVFNEQGEMIDEISSPQLAVESNFDFSEMEKEVLFEGENSMLGHREENIKRTENYIEEIADRVVPFLNGEISEEEMNLREDVHYENRADAELYLNAQKKSEGPIDLVEEAKKAQAKHDAKESDVRMRITAEMESIRDKAKKDGTFMKAPNGQNTNLTEEQWLMVRTKNFINWFGDWINDPANASKIVDENGEPMVMIHGSQNKFSVFRRGRGPHGSSGRGMYFGRAPKDIDSFSYGGASGQKYLVFLNVRNLYDSTKYRIDRKLRSNDVGKLIPKDVMDEIIGTSSYEEFVESVTDINKARFASSQSIVKDISKKTYQRIHDSFDGKGMFTSKENVVKRIFRKNRTYLTLNHDFIGEIVVRDPNQIKSATDNIGTFDTNNPDIRFRVVDTTKAELKEKPIKLNGAHRFKLKSAFKGIKDSSGQFGYVTTQIRVGNETMEDPYRVRFDGSLEGYAVIYIRPDLAKITEDEEKEHTFYLDPMPIKDALWEALKAAENYYEAKYANGPWAKTKNPGPFGYSDWQNADKDSESSIRFRVRTEEEREKLFADAKEKYGVTDNFNAAGYMLPDGSLLDFSEANDGGDPNSRSLDHRDIEGVIMDNGVEYDSRWMYIADFMNEGAIRLLPESAGINMIQAPTEEQRKKIFDFIYKYNGEVILEINDERLNSVAYMEYGRRTSPSRIFRDIDGYFNDGIIPQQDVRFRMSNNNQAIFVSNAARAVEGIKQEKATPEQWLKMIEKAGGLKAGEDKWIGLSDWLKASDKKTLTKQEVLDFINENMIVINEVHYGARAEEAAAEQHALLEQRVNERYEEILDSIQDIEDYDEKRTKAFEQLKDELDEWGDYVDLDMYNVYLTFPYEDLGDYIEMADIFGVEISLGNPINDVRLNYTTDGLDNKREIALTVPTIESWNKSDDIHFGDAGDGRAVAWIRFGETEVPTGEYKVLLDEMNRLKEVARELYEEFGGRSNELAEVEERQDELRAEMRSYKNPGLKVLVIDEIQSKRHQEGREKGYRVTNIDKWLKDNNVEVIETGEFFEFIKNGETDRRFSKGLMNYDIEKAKRLYVSGYNKSDIPDAPFDKNWHELAMKRMLRYAAENGYDVIAWTKGDQQAQRYNLGGYVSSIEMMEEHDGFVDFAFYIGDSDESSTIGVEKETGIISLAEEPLSAAEGRPLADLVGKELAVKIMQMEESDVLEDADLQIGGEGMRGFYDKMLPAFMNKYGKRWGVKVEDIELPNLEDGLTMHSIPVTEEMKASVMEGQVMFRMRGENESAEEFVNGIIDDFKAKYNAFNEIIALDPTSKTQVAKFIGVSEEDISDEDMASFLKELEERDSRGWYNNKRIAIFVRKNVTDGKKSELVLIHENIHAINKEQPELIAIGEYLWNTAQKGTREYKYKMAIAKAYPESEWFDEMSAYVVSEYMQDEQIDKLKSLLDSDNIESLNKLLNISGYGKDRSKQRPRVTWNVLRKRPSETTEESGRTEEGGEPGDLRFRTTEITPEVRDEMDTIAAIAIVNGNYMKAPNGKDSNLTAEQWAMVRTKNFKSWFGDWENDPENASKVVDENGEPMVVYHGTAGVINSFEDQQRSPGFWFVDREDVANGYAESASVEFGEDKNVIPVFLNIRNPRTEDAYGEFPAEFALKSYVENDNGVYQEFDTYEEAEAYRKENVPDGWVGASKVGDQHDLVERAVELGHDGVIMKNMHDQAAYAETRVQGTQTNYVVLSPSQIKSATDNTGEFSEGEGDIRFSIRTKPAPKKTGKGYKVFYLKDGKLYPPMVANLGGVDTPVGVWLDAEEGTRAGVSKTGRPQVKQGGKGTQGGSGTLAYRPGWHLGEIPYAIQFNRKDENGDRTLFPADFVWAEVEYANDVDYQEEAMNYGMNANGKFQHSLAGLPKLPIDGSYRYRTNPNPETDPWIITGAMKVNRLLTPSEVDQMVVDAGREPQKRQEGAVTDEQIEALNKELGLEETVSFRFSSSTADEIDIKAMRGISTLRAFNVSFSEMRKIFYDVAEETEKAIMQLRAKQNRTAYDNEKLAREEKELRAIHRRIDWWESVNSQLVSTDTEPTALKDGDFDLEPRTPAEFISKFLTMSMTRVNKQFVDKEGKAGIKKVNKRAGVMLTQDTLRRELGWNEKDWSGFRYILSESEGKSLDEIAEMIYEDSDAQSIFAGMDVMDIKNEIIDFLQSVRSYADIRDYIKNERTREAKEERDYLDGLVAATIEQIESSTGMTIDEYNDRIITEELKDIERILRDVETSEIYGKFEDLTDQENEAYQRSLLEGAEGGIQEGDQAVPDLGDGAMDSAAAENSEPQGDSRGADTGDVGDSADESGGSRIPPIGNKRKGLVQEPMELSSESASVDEVVNKGRQKAINENVQANDIFSEKVQRLNNSLAKLRSALAAQREYDVNTVKIITALANELLQIGRLTDMSRSEIKRLLSVIKDATGKEDLSIAVERLMDIMIANQLRSGKSKISELTKIKASKVNASGVEVRGSLDVAGQQMLQTFKDSIAPTMTDETLAENIAIEESNLDSDSDVIRKNAENRLAGYYLAQQYRENILASEAEEKSIREEIKRAKEQHDAGLMDKAAYKEFVKSCYDAIRENRMERVTAYEKLANQLAAKLAGSILNAKLLKDAEKARIEQIHHFANSDMQGMPSVQQGEVKKGIWNNTILRFLFKPLATFDQMLRSFAPKSRNGEGYLWNHFMGGWLRSSENEFKGIQAAHEQLDAKVRSIFAGVKRWSDLFSIEKKLPTMEVKFWDGEKMADFTLTQGNLLYIYMVNKMTDGKMKLRKMGITEEDVNNIARELDPRFIELADWIQDTFLPGLREKYNTLHEKMFGAPMAAIDNYFPIRVLANARTREVDLAVEESSARPSTITGSIIKRTKNSLALDILGSDAFDVVLEHIEQMEHWAAFAEFNRDLNTLLSYRKFRNRVQNMRGIYGAGTTVWNNFRSVAEIAAGVYKPAVKGDSLDKLITNIAKGVTGAKISFRVYTALKQFLSAPAFVSDASAAALIKSLANPYKAWTWAMKELPLFEKRWKSRQAGDSRLMETESDWKLWKNKIVELAGRYGMTPNAFVDALTVSIGARAIYETKRKEYVKLGYTQDQAEEKAKRDATVLFNESQQSNESAFLSAAQVDRTVASILITVFRNSSMGYQRMYVDALRNIKHMLKKGYKAESLEYMKKQMMRDGLTEDQAERAANRIYNKSFARSATRLATFGFLVQFAWNLGPYMAYLLMGDDDDEKKDMIKDAAVRGLVGGPVEGLAAGQAISGVLGDFAMSEEISDPMLKLPATSDMESIFRQLEVDPVRAVNDIFNLVIQSGIGVNPQTLTDAVVAIIDGCNGDLETSKEAAFALMRILQTPQSQIEKLYMEEIDFTAEEALDMSVREFAERYAKYKVMRTAPLTKWMYSDEKEKELEDKYIKTFTKKASEMERTHGTEEAQEFFEYYDSEYEETAETLRDLKKQLKEAILDSDTEGEAKANEDIDNFLESEEFKRFEELLPHIKAYEAYRKALKTIDDPKTRSEYAEKMIQERNAAVEILRGEEISDL